MGFVSSLVALPVFAEEMLPAERPEWERLRAEHLGELRRAFDVGVGRQFGDCSWAAEDADPRAYGVDDNQRTAKRQFLRDLFSMSGTTQRANCAGPIM